MNKWQIVRLENGHDVRLLTAVTFTEATNAARNDYNNRGGAEEFQWTHDPEAELWYFNEGNHHYEMEMVEGWP